MKSFKALNYILLPIICMVFLATGLVVYQASSYSMRQDLIKAWKHRFELIRDDIRLEVRAYQSDLTSVLNSPEVLNWSQSEAIDERSYQMESYIYALINRVKKNNPGIRTFHVLNAKRNILISVDQSDPFDEASLPTIHRYTEDEFMDFIFAKSDSEQHKALLYKNEADRDHLVLIQAFSPGLILDDNNVGSDDNSYIAILTGELNTFQTTRDHLSQEVEQGFNLKLTPVLKYQTHESSLDKTTITANDTDDFPITLTLNDSLYKLELTLTSDSLHRKRSDLAKWIFALMTFSSCFCFVIFRILITKIKYSLVLVREKSKQIETILNNINEGIFVIQSNYQIGKECSPKFSQLLKEAQCNPTTYHDVLKSLMNGLSNDQINIALTSLDASIGEDEFQWTMNAHNLPTESHFTTPEGKERLLEWDWSPIHNEANIITDILISVRDVTLLKQLEQESSKEKNRIKTIYNIIEAGMEKTDKFLETSSNFIAENRQHIEESPEIDQNVISLLFRNMHTIKGNARTLNFSSISEISHTIESHYDQLRKGTQKADRKKMLRELDELNNRIEEYAAVLHVNLAGTLINNTTSKADELIENITAILQTEYENKLEKIDQILLNYDSVNLSDIVDHHIKALPGLASELGKATPEVKIIGHGVRIKQELANTLSESMTHLFRNSIDHGIETPDERTAAGKPPQGIITIEITKQDNGEYALFFGDDGAGLNLRDLSMHAPGHNPPDGEVAARIFESGTSTAESATDISGRGVGMDAVKSFLQQHGSQISVTFTGPRSNAGYRPFRFAMTLPTSQLTTIYSPSISA